MGHVDELIFMMRNQNAFETTVTFRRHGSRWVASARLICGAVTAHGTSKDEAAERLMPNIPSYYEVRVDSNG